MEVDGGGKRAGQVTESDELDVLFGPHARQFTVPPALGVATLPHRRGNALAGAT
jgi:hypothetical protein